MASMIVKVVLCIIIPMMLLTGMLDRRSRYIAVAVCAGCVMCLGAYYINSWSYDFLDCSYFYLTTSVSPFIEEILKFIPILLFSVFVSKDKRPLISFAFAVGIGFAIIENSFMLAQSGETSTVSWMLIRGIGTGLMHGMSTAIVGGGIFIASRDKRLLLTGTTATLFFAMLYHGTYNAMIMTENIKYFGIFVPLASYVAVLALLNKRAIRKFFDEG